MKIKYSVFNPCGNITVLVATSVDKENRIKVANRIMELEPTCEQVGFVAVNEDYAMLEMAGGEFCGNATRCASLLTGKNKILCSGYNEFIDVEVKDDIVKISLPSAPTGIEHTIILDQPKKKYEDDIKNELVACGYMFVDGDNLTPLVYIPTSGTLFWEKSCASGSMVAGLFFAKKEGKDVEKRFVEPGGELYVSAKQTGEVALWGKISKIKDTEFEFE